MSRDESDSDNTQRSTFGSLIMDFRVPPPIAVAPSRGRGFDQSLPPPRAQWIKNCANRALAAGVIEELWAGRGQRWDSRYFLPTNLPYVLKSVWNGYVFPRPGSL